MKRDELSAKIIRDLGSRTDVTSDVSAAISSAVQHYNRERFYFLEEGTATFSASASQASYTAPSNLAGRVDAVLITISGHKNPLQRVDYTEIAEKDDGVLVGSPSEWCFYANKIRLWPLPNAAYTMHISYHGSIADATISGSNVWTNEAGDLIRFRAAWDISKHIIRDAEGAAIFKDSEIEALHSLLKETEMKVTSGRLKKTEW